MKKNLLLQGLIDKKEDFVVEVRTEGQADQFKSYCCVTSANRHYRPVELEAYTTELDARAGHLNWLNQRERCLAYLQSLGLRTNSRPSTN